MVARFVKMALAAGVPFGLFMGLFFGVSGGTTVGVIAGAGCGVLFGVALAAFGEFQRKRFESVAPQAFEGETVVRHGPANHFLGAESRGGWLTLTDSRLSFRSHGANLQNQPVDIPLPDIVASRPSMTMGIIPNGLQVDVTGGGRESFVVTGRREWVTAIEAACQRTGGARSPFA